MEDITVSIELHEEPPNDSKCDAEKKQVRNTFIVQLLVTTSIIAFAVYEIASTGKMPDKNSLYFGMVTGMVSLYLPQPKLFK
jgi:hypothetical protein